MQEKGAQNCFAVVYNKNGKEHREIFSAASEQEQKKWINALNQTINPSAVVV